MGIEHPSPQVVRAIEAAVAWFRASQIKEIRSSHAGPGHPKRDRQRPDRGPRRATALGAILRIGHQPPDLLRPRFLVKYSMAEIEYERRNGYRWYVDRPARLLEPDYPEWLRSHRP